ncbi:HNH endonuclease [Halobaculum litoreum]|uniref:HNH endonuclease n=1 Tax=Halobaculum litoreum TaxID=3031998 RepID=A0ABD5XW16_9EURY
MCGSEQGADDGRALHVHHIVPVLAGGTSEPWNLITLCAACHRRVETYTKDIVDLILGPESCTPPRVTTNTPAFEPRP